MAELGPNEEITALLKSINAAGETLSLAGASKASEARQALLLEAKKLVASLEDPEAEVWPRAFQINVGVSLFLSLTNLSLSGADCKW